MSDGNGSFIVTDDMVEKSILLSSMGELVSPIDSLVIETAIKSDETYKPHMSIQALYQNVINTVNMALNETGIHFFRFQIGKYTLFFMVDDEK